MPQRLHYLLYDEGRLRDDRASAQRHARMIFGGI